MNISILTVHLINSMLIFYMISIHAHIKMNVDIDFLFNTLPLFYFPLYTLLFLLT